MGQSGRAPRAHKGRECRVQRRTGVLLRAAVASASWLVPEVMAADEQPNLPPATVFGARTGTSSDSADSGALPWLRDAQSSSVLDRTALDRWEPRRLEDLTGLLPGTVVDTLNAGLSTAVKVRGFAPFTFGTVITNEGAPGSPVQPAQVAWDRLLALEGGAPATRRYHDSHLRWQHRLGDDWQLRASFGQAIVTRDETLIGFWTITSPSTVSSYYTQYHDSYRQRSARVEASANLGTGAVQHDLRFGLDRYRQRFHFEGVQNIGGSTIDIGNPDFSAVDPAQLELTRRYNDERIEEDAHGSPTS